MNKACEKFQDRFSDFIDRELNPEDWRGLEQHLEQCPECRQELRMLRLTTEAVRKLPVLPAPADFLIKLRQKMAREPGPVQAGVFRQATRWMIARPSLIAAGFVLVFSGAFLLGRFNPAAGIAMQHSEMDPVQAWVQPIAADNWRLEEAVPTKVSARVSTVYKVAAAPSPAGGSNLSMPAASSAGYARPELAESLSAKDEGEKSQEAQSHPQVFLQTPTQFVINLLRSDPAFQGAKIYPVSRGALAQTPEFLFRITISDQNFINALKWLADKKPLPGAIEESRKAFNLEIEKMPNPLKPTK